jgi:hypothetical protein
MKYKLNKKIWDDLDKIYDAEAGLQLVRDERVLYWRNAIMQQYGLEYEENYRDGADYGTISGEEHRITWFLLNI